MKNLALLAFCVFILSGCAASGFSQFYDGRTIEYLQADPAYIPETTVQVRRLPDEPLDTIFSKMYATQYLPVGSSEWEGAAGANDSAAIAQAKKIGASLVMWGANYSHTASGVAPVTTYSPGGVATTYHSGTVFAGGGSGQYSGTSTTYNPGTFSTNYVPYSVDRYNYVAIFFAKFKPGLLGAKLDFTPPIEYKKQFDTSTGALVLGVVDGWRASKANILPGDTIMSVNGINFTESFDDWKYGEENTVQVYRDGKTLTKKIFLEPQAQNIAN